MTRRGRKPPVGRRKTFALRAFDKPVTVAEVAASIGAGLARAALAGRVDGKLVDTSFVIDHDADLAVVTEKDADGVDILRHSSAHLLADVIRGGGCSGSVSFNSCNSTFSSFSGCV